MRYITYAFSGAMGILGGMALIYAHVGSLEYGPFMEAVPSMSNGQIWALLLLMGGGFMVKMALLPFHLWQAQAYAETPGPGAVFLGAISARMGLYALMVVLVGMVGIARLVQRTAAAADLLDVARAYAEELAPLGANRKVFKAQKESLYGENAALNAVHGAAYMLRNSHAYR